MACLRRRAAGRKPEPSLGIIDTQSVKCIPVRGPRGHDAAKKVLGRKRVALVDADGTWLAVAVVPASTQERDTLPALDTGKAEWPSLREAILDGGFVAERCQDWSNRHGMRHRVVQRDPGQKGFVVLERRWVVERSFGWLAHWGGLLRDRAGRLDVTGSRVEMGSRRVSAKAVMNRRRAALLPNSERSTTQARGRVATSWPRAAPMPSSSGMSAWRPPNTTTG